MSKEEFVEIKKSLLLKMRFMDTTIKGISETVEYKENCAYNDGIRECIQELQKHVLEH